MIKRVKISKSGKYGAYFLLLRAFRGDCMEGVLWLESQKWQYVIESVNYEGILINSMFLEDFGKAIIRVKILILCIFK